MSNIFKRILLVKVKTSVCSEYCDIKSHGVAAGMTGMREGVKIQTLPGLNTLSREAL